MSIDRKNWIFRNDPFQMLDIAFRRLFPNIEYEAVFVPNLKDDDGKEMYGLTTFTPDGEIEIAVGTQLAMNDTIETFAHELAHAAVGIEHDHDDVWAKAFDDLFDEYNNVAEELFGASVEKPPRGADYIEMLEEMGIEP